MSDSQARKVAQMVHYSNAVEAAQEATFYNDLTWFKAVAAQENTIPAAWMPTAVCEEGGRNDPYAGYFGILEWNHFDGYPTAGSAPASVQLAWEAAHGQGPPDAPGQCHGYWGSLSQSSSATPLRTWPSPAPCRSSPAMRWSPRPRR